VLAGDGCLQHDRAAGAHEPQGRRQARGRPGAIDDHVERPGQCRGLVEGMSRDARPGEPELFGMLADELDLSARLGGHAGAKEAELAVANDRRAHPRPELDLLEDPEGGRQRLDEDGRPVVDQPPVEHPVALGLGLPLRARQLFPGVAGEVPKSLVLFYIGRTPLMHIAAEPPVTDSKRVRIGEQP